MRNAVALLIGVGHVTGWIAHVPASRPALAPIPSHIPLIIMQAGSGYKRGRDDGNENVDVQQIEALLEDRNTARRERRFDEADGIRDQLQNMDVHIYDKERTWVHGVDAKAPPKREPRGNNFYRNTQRRYGGSDDDRGGRYDGGGGRGGRYSSDDNGSRGGYDRGYGSGSSGSRGGRYSEDDLSGGRRGGRGGGYDDGYGGAAGGRGGYADAPLPLSAEMNGKLEAWVAAKRQRDFETSDRLRAEMKDAGFNPEEYRPARREPNSQRGGYGGGGGGYGAGGGGYREPNSQRGGYGGGGGGYGAAGGGYRGGYDDERVSGRAGRGDRAPRDRAPQQPRERERNEWGHDYDRAHNDEAKIDGATLLAVNQLIRERMNAKMGRQFERADELLAQLEAEYSVRIDDGKKRWRADDQSFERQYTRVGSGGDVDEAAVTELISSRVAARKARDYRRADDALEELLTTHGVVLVDAEYTWRLVGVAHDGGYGEGGSYGRRADDDAPGTHDYRPLYEDDAAHARSQGTFDAIDGLLAQRLAHKKGRRFDQADELQEKLRVEYGVVVDDRNRSWTVEFGASGGDEEGSGAAGGDEPPASVDEPLPSVDEPSASVDEPPASVDEPSASIDAPSDPVPIDAEEVRSMTVVQLKAALKERGLSVSGLKPALAARLLEAVGANDDADDD